MESFTILTYLTNSAILRQKAIVTDIGSDERGDFIITNITPAYPQGGGQESDQGKIITSVGVSQFNDVRYFERSVKHYLQNGQEKLKKGDNIEIVVDETRRIQNSILHSAGHLVASVVFKYFFNLIPTKGHHFFEGSYVEFSGELSGKAEEITKKLQIILDEEIKTEKYVSSELITSEELNTKSPFIQQGLPKDKLLRVIKIESYFPIGCGGTHVETLNEIPMLNITKIKTSKGVVRIGYRCFN